MSASRHHPLVEPLANREDDAVEGAFYVVRARCTTCQLPCETAPANVQWNEGYVSEGKWGPGPKHCRVVKQPETDEELEMMIEACVGSCTENIRYCGTDAYTLELFRKEGMLKLCDASSEAEYAPGTEREAKEGPPRQLD